MSESATTTAPPKIARLVLAGQLSLHRPGSGPLAVPIRFARPIRCGEQPYLREIRVGSEWQPLDTGWLAESGASFLTLTNNRELVQRNPSVEEKAAIEACVVEVGIRLPQAPRKKANMWDEVPPDVEPIACWLIPPGETLPATPANPALLHLRCQAGIARVTLHLIPR